MNKIINLKKLGNQFFWTVKDATDYKTNQSGSGRFYWNIIQNCWSQDKGTCDWSLAGYSISGARKKLIREFNR